MTDGKRFTPVVVPLTTLAPNEDIVAELTRVLEDAKAGKVRSIAWLLITQDGGGEQVLNIDPDDNLMMGFYIGQMNYGFHRQFYEAC